MVDRKVGRSTRDSISPGGQILRPSSGAAVGRDTLGPQLSAHLFNSSNAILAGTGIVLLTGAAAVAQLCAGHTAPWIGASAGSVGLAAGMICIAVAAAVNSNVAFLAGALVGGVGFGLSFLGGLRALVVAIPSEQRAAVMSAFYIAAYASLSLPAVVAGTVVRRLGLAPTFEVFGSLAAAVALIVAWQA